MTKLKRFEGVKGVIVLNKEGQPISTTYNTEKTQRIAGPVLLIINNSNYVAEVLTNESLSFMTLTIFDNELLIAPEEEYILIVVKEKGTMIL